MFGRKEEKKLKIDERDVVNTIHYLISEGKISYSELKPIVNKYSETIDVEIERRKQESRQRVIACMKHTVELNKNDVEVLKQKLDNINKNIVEMKAEREDISKQGYGRDENRLRNLCWWIYNNENEAARLEGELKTKEAQVMESEKVLQKKLDGDE